MKLRVGVIGLGNMGKHHVRNYHEIPDVEVAGICDLNPDVLKLFTHYGYPMFTDLDTMLAQSNLDAVSITVPTRYHHEVAQKVIESGIHLLVEKPISDSLEQADDIVKRAKDKGVILAVGHIERFNPAVIRLKELVDSGAIGKITSIIAKRVGAFPAQIKDANVVIDLAVHDIDIFS
ncbi:MAG: Gfo/Idh/MocA family oxidoreductase, partial [Candidatus Margulisbacteria bacterium]|nr:Gfo/Idh/MocA family oxidoreductase [Candidatus Margulisiibacteriota bacterium]